MSRTKSRSGLGVRPFKAMVGTLGDYEWSAVSAVKRAVDAVVFRIFKPYPGRRALPLPSHPAVTAYINQLKANNVLRRRDLEGRDGRISIDLKTARRKAKAARTHYENRVEFIRQCAIEKPTTFTAMSSLLEARADAMFWRSIVTELEYFARIKQGNRWAVARSQVTPI